MRAILVGLFLCLSVITSGHAAPATPAPDTLTFSDGIYVGRVLMTLNLLEDSLRQYTTAMGDPAPLDPTWRAAAGAAPRMWEAVFDQFSTVNPAPRFAAMHEQLLDALESLALAADDCINGIDNLDPVAAADCNAGIVRSTTLMNAVELSIMPAAP